MAYCRDSRRRNQCDSVQTVPGAAPKVAIELNLESTMGILNEATAARAARAVGSLSRHPVAGSARDRGLGQCGGRGCALLALRARRPRSRVSRDPARAAGQTIRARLNMPPASIAVATERANQSRRELR